MIRLKNLKQNLTKNSDYQTLEESVNNDIDQAFTIDEDDSLEEVGHVYDNDDETRANTAKKSSSKSQQNRGGVGSYLLAVFVVFLVLYITPLKEIIFPESQKSQSPSLPTLQKSDIPETSIAGAILNEIPTSIKSESQENEDLSETKLLEQEKQAEEAHNLKMADKNSMNSQEHENFDPTKNIQLTENQFEPKIYFQNRMSRSGQSSIKILLEVLQENNNFIMIEDQSEGNFDPNLGKEEREINLKTNIIENWKKNQLDKSILVNQNLPFSVSEELESSLKTEIGVDLFYLNIIRNPVDRFISLVNFCLSDSISGSGTFTNLHVEAECQALNFSEDDHSASPQDYLEKLIRVKEQVVSFGNDTKSSELSSLISNLDQFYLTSFFSDTDLQTLKAIEAIGVKPFYQQKFGPKSKFLSVGILEKMDLTLKILEKKMPEIFTGAKTIWANDARVIDQIEKATKNVKIHQDVSQEIRKKLEESLFSKEMTLYDFLVERLEQQGGVL